MLKLICLIAIIFCFNCQVEFPAKVRPQSLMKIKIKSPSADVMYYKYTGDKIFRIPINIYRIKKKSGIVYEKRVLTPMTLGTYKLSWIGVGTDIKFERNLTVVCNDDLFCNGEEINIHGRCVRGKKPCKSSDKCKIGVCNEKERTCSFKQKKSKKCS